MWILPWRGQRESLVWGLTTVIKDHGELAVSLRLRLGETQRGDFGFGFGADGAFAVDDLEADGGVGFLPLDLNAAEMVVSHHRTDSVLIRFHGGP